MGRWPASQELMEYIRDQKVKGKVIKLHDAETEIVPNF